MTAVTTPKAPSEPITTSRRSGPAALAGELPSTSSPCGVATRRPTTSESKRPYPAEDWPLERVTAKPPIEAYSKDCGKWPRVRPCSASSASACGPRRPGLEGGGHRVGVDREQPVEADQVERDHAGEPVAAGGEPADDRGPAAERHERDVALDGPRDQGRDLLVRGRPDDGVG